MVSMEAVVAELLRLGHLAQHVAPTRSSERVEQGLFDKSTGLAAGAQEGRGKGERAGGGGRITDESDIVMTQGPRIAVEARAEESIN